MQTGIIGGTGPEGRGLAARLAAAGVHVLVGSRDLERARAAVDKIASAGTLPDARLLEPATNDAVVDRCDVIFLAVAFAGVDEVAAQYAERWREGVVLVDMTVPLSFADGQPVFHELPEGSSAERLRAILPARVRLAATLKTIPAYVLGRVNVPLDCDEFIAADSAAARDAATAALSIPGLRLIDAGPLDAARALERMTLLCVGINKRYKVRTARFRVVGL